MTIHQMGRVYFTGCLLFELGDQNGKDKDTSQDLNEGKLLRKPDPGGDYGKDGLKPKE